MSALDKLTTNKKAIMKAARHLNASRMAWVANRLMSGVDWRGSPKGCIADALAVCGRHRNAAPIEQADLDTVCYRLRSQANAAGKAALSAEDVDQVNASISRLRSRAAELEPALALHNSRKRVHYGVESEHTNCIREARRLERALENIVF